MRAGFVLLALGVLGVSDSAAAAAHARTLVITVKSVETSARSIDRPPKGIARGQFSAGDVLILHDRLINLARQLGRPKGATVGVDEATLTFTSNTNAKLVGSATFPDGSVRFRGSVSANAKGTLVMSVIGGTGAYARARGTVSEPATDSNPANARNTYRLSLP
jgi:Dirigent-like protein